MEIFTAFGQLGVSAEKVASDAAREAREYLSSQAAAGEHLTDQLLLPMALAGSGCFAALKMNLHARTNIEVIAKFLPVRFAVTEAEGYSRIEAAK
jgi:RNA 3'-terminal phosphate cyclase (ATP)